MSMSSDEWREEINIRDRVIAGLLRKTGEFDTYDPRVSIEVLLSSRELNFNDATEIDPSGKCGLRIRVKDIQDSENVLY